MEGNISAGKTTFLNVVKEGLRGNEELQAEDMETVPEPVDMWQAVGPGKHNLLDEFYKNPQENAYLFQNYVFFTRMMQVGVVLRPIMFSFMLLCLCTKLERLQVDAPCC